MGGDSGSEAGEQAGEAPRRGEAGEGDEEEQEVEHGGQLRRAGMRSSCDRTD
jgi:hypothetical protein